MSATSPTSTSGFTTKIAHPERDAEAVICIWRQHHGAAPDARYRWLFRSPGARAWCLLLHDAHHRTVGTTSLVVRRFHCGDQTVFDGGQTIDLIIDPAYRSGGPAIQLQRALLRVAAERGIGLLYGAPIRAAELVQRRVGFRVLGQLHRWRKSLDAAHDLPAAIAPAALRLLVGWLADTVIRLYSGELLSVGRKWSVSIEPTFDARFDDLWSRARGRFGIIGERTSAYLNWRFGADAPRRYGVFCLTDRDGRLDGYIVYTSGEDGADIADLLFVDTRALRALLARFASAMRQKRMKHITFNCLIPPSIGTVLKRAGFFRRPQQANVLLWTGALAQAPSTLAQAENWFLTDADRDV